VAIQRFLPRGPLAILPMGQHGMYSVFATAVPLAATFFF
jgi:2-polyprenyl-6-methoxyphenol hydroxylase-like FAD-dependent oxidoreductase